MNEKIPKYIHYCWFGKNKIPRKYQKYINTWSHFLPDYKIIKWNEENFPIKEFAFAKEALEKGKWAFISDVARIYALKTMGGIYFDTDVEMIKPFYDILQNRGAILGTEGIKERTIGTGFMAFRPAHPICERMFEYYLNSHFIKADGTLNMYPNTCLMADVIQELYNICPSDEIQCCADMILYPQEYFTAYNGELGRTVIEPETYCVHHFAASWQPKRQRIKYILKTTKNRIIYKFPIKRRE